MNGRCLFLLIFLVAWTPLHPPAAQTRSCTGGSLQGGAVLCLAADPSERDVIYAGTWAGLYRSTNAGAHWSPVQLPFPDPVYTVAWNADQTALFAGGAGRIFWAERSGVSWSTLQLPADGAPPVTALLFDPDSPTRFIAGTGGRGVFHSDDGGKTWAEIPPSGGDAEQLGVRYVTDLAWDEVSDTVYVATQSSLFKIIANGLKRTDETFASALVFRPQDSRLYAAAGNALRSGYLQTTLWGPVFRWTETPAGGDVPNSILELCVDPYDPALMWAGAASGIYRGRFQINPGTGKETIIWARSHEVQGAIGSIVCAGVESGKAIAGGTSGFWITADAGESWLTSNSGIRGSRLVDVLPMPGRPGVVFGAALDSLVYASGARIRVLRSDDWGATWRWVFEAPSSGVRPSLAIDPGGLPQTLFPATIFLEGQRASTDLGETWTADIPLVNPAGRVGSFYIDPGNPDNQAMWIHYRGAIGDYNFIRVTSNGWADFREMIGSARLLRTDPHSPYSLYFSCGRIFHWDGSSTPPALVVPFENVEDFEIDRHLPGRLYVVSDKRLYIYPGAGRQAEEAKLPPEAWTLTVRSHLILPGVVAAGTTDGLYVSRDYGASWEKVDTRGLDVGHVFGLSFDPADASIVYLAGARGAFRVRFTNSPGGRRSQRRMGLM